MLEELKSFASLRNEKCFHFFNEFGYNLVLNSYSRRKEVIKLNSVQTYNKIICALS
jgi:uncharacterized protein YerC